MTLGCYFYFNWKSNSGVFFYAVTRTLKTCIQENKLCLKTYSHSIPGRTCMSYNKRWRPSQNFYFCWWSCSNLIHLSSL